MPPFEIVETSIVTATNKQAVYIYGSYIYTVIRYPRCTTIWLLFIFIFIFSVHQIDFFFIFLLYGTRLQSQAISNSYNVNHYLKCPRASYELRTDEEKDKKKCLFIARKNQMNKNGNLCALIGLS